ncbi:MAG: 30S ribosomal protein S6 [Sedimentisphaerales bacterium]|nr:30S ribosomal protein S6 [Sedimentisphaerales bacterium]
MKTVTKNLYEAMFLVDSAQAAADWDGIVGLIKNILTRADVEIVSLVKWSDRKLIYPINHKSRGIYILCYFKADGEKIRDIERDVQLNERIMRVLILSVDKQRIEDMDKNAPKMSAESSDRAEKDQAEVPQEVEKGQADIDTNDVKPTDTEDADVLK